MILFFGSPSDLIFAVEVAHPLQASEYEKLVWLFGNQPLLDRQALPGPFIGPRAAMITPWSTNAVEITQNMAIRDVSRIERFVPAGKGGTFDPMLFQHYAQLDQQIFTIHITPAAIQPVKDIAAYNQAEGLALNPEEIVYLEALAQRLGRPLTDSEVFGFSQVNSEHCRHKIFNGTFVIDGQEQSQSLFKLIKATSQAHPNSIVSAYRDNVAFVKGPQIVQFAPAKPDQPDWYQRTPIHTVLSLKAETHNFPTTVEPFNGAATGSGGEIRDRLAGGQGSLPLAGTAVYMTAYSRLQGNRPWEQAFPARKWLYQTPMDILIKASNGASDFGNKFGQPLINGSVLTFEQNMGDRQLGYDKVIMMAGGIGYGRAEQAQKHTPKPGDQIVVMGGDNYRIGMGGASVSSSDTGEFGTGLELNAVQRSNPEMQKRVANAIRGMVESSTNAIVSIHDHGAGGHLNSLSELVEETGGVIYLNRLPVGDPTLSAKEIIGNESQERMGLIIAPEDLPTLKAIAARERAPLYVVGEVTGDMRFVFVSEETGEKPMDMALSDMFGSSPKTIMEDRRVARRYEAVSYLAGELPTYLAQVLKLEAVACKDWLTNKVDRCVGGLVAKQQCVGPLQLPLNNCGVMALDYESGHGIATAIGHAPISGLIDPVAGSRNSVAEALTNLVWAPLQEGLRSVSLSANWMWPCRNEGEDARLYEAVQGLSEFVIELGINVPTGKDSLSMKQKYPDGEVLAPGTVIVSASGHCDDITRVVEPVLQANGGPLYYLPLSGDTFKLGGSSFAQIHNTIGDQTPTVYDAAYFALAFDAVQTLIREDLVLAGHDISAGGLITALLEMCFSDTAAGLQLDLSSLESPDLITLLFAENVGLLIQAKDEQIEKRFSQLGIKAYRIGKPGTPGHISLTYKNETHHFDIAEYRQHWYETSWLLDRRQTTPPLADERYQNYMKQPLHYTFPQSFSGKKPVRPARRPKAAVLREKGSNSERELANALYMAGFDVKDVHMTDLISGRETLEDIRFLGAVGGFSNSDVLGSAKGWAGAFLYNDKAKNALDRFFAREDVLSIGICNGCQLFMELNLINPEHSQQGFMHFNDSGKHESIFTSVEVLPNHAVMMKDLAGARLGIWVSHGEGKFYLPEPESAYHIVAKFGYEAYPANPNGSAFNTAMLASADGRHLATMPHLERSAFPWNWAHYPKDRQDEVSPWIEAFLNARGWM
ncbi:MAG: phosphoribosylformylglycinamidine synthase [Bacteroidia bacterium]|nr:phosphoribosylformylglycinamidine synthase [Bacteroidia bacterium]